MIRHGLSFPRAFLFALIIFECMFSLSANASNRDTILILHSYDREYKWTEDINTGIIEALDNLSRPHLVCTEYLDWKRFPDPRNIDNLYVQFKNKYSKTKINVIIVSDDKALQFAVQHRKDIFSNAPVVYTGVYKEAVQFLTGVYEEQDIKTTLKIAFKIQDPVHDAYTISDLSESGQEVEQHIRNELHEIAQNIPVWTLSNMPIDDIESFVKKLGPHDLLIIGSYSIDKLGQTYTGETLIGRVSQAAHTPVYILNTHHLGTGALGGNLLSPVLLGQNAGNLALKVLSGVPADSIEPLSNSSFTAMFDYKTVRRFGINLSQLPHNSVFVNRETPVYVKYQKELVGIAILFVIMVFFLYILFLNFKKQKKLAESLASRNEEISLLNESLSQSEEKLRQQFTEISIIKESLEESEERYRLSLLGSNDAMWDWDYQTKTMHYSTRWYEMSGYSHEKNRNLSLREIMHPDDKMQYEKTFQSHMNDASDHFKCEARIKTAFGAWKWISIRGKAVRNNRNEPVRFAGSITDIDDRKQKEAEIENLAYYDQLTSLPNRTLSIEIARQMLDSAETGTRCGLMFINIENFKYVNDSFGHPTGDKILVTVAKILSSLVTEDIKTGRFSGDEFVILVSDTTPSQMEKYAILALTLLERKMEINGRNHFLTVSAGIAIYPDHASRLEELFQKADAALHRARKEGKTRYCFFNDSIQAELVKKIELENGLRSAIDNNEFYVVYQPQINLSTGRIAGFEALARWNYPLKGEISPGEFIPVAEQSGQIDRIGAFVLRTAARFLKRAEKNGYKDFTISVNVSVKEIQEEDFIFRTKQIIKEESVNPERISLEITESVLIESFVHVVEKLKQLRETGFKLSLDDFGKGYSSLSYLKTLPISYIKIDKSFIDDITATEMSASLARSMIEMAHQLGLIIIAEGVEIAEQKEYLKAHNCDLIQGYYYSKPSEEDTAIHQLELSFS